MPDSRLSRDHARLLIVDVQERLLPAMRESQRVERGCVLLARAFSLLQLPILVTEQNPSRLGLTIESVRESVPNFAPVSKMRFSACVPEITNAIPTNAQIVVCGLEAHVCITQTALDLRERGHAVFVPRDCVSSRHESDERAAFERMAQIGCIACSAEMLTFELLQSADAPEFKALLPFVK